MKLIISLMFLALSPLTSRAQGSDVGNGGNVFWCADRPKGERALFIDSAQMDSDSVYFPDKKQVPIPGDTLSVKLLNFSKRIGKFDQGRESEYYALAQLILREFTGTNLRKEDRSYAFPKLDGEELFLRTDFNIRTLPKGCKVRPFINQLVKPSAGRPWLKFDPELVSELPPDDLVKAVYHEVAYQEAIKYYLAQGYKINDINSDAVRNWIGKVGSAGWDQMATFCAYTEYLNQDVDFIQSVRIPGRGYRLDRYRDGSGNGIFALYQCTEGLIRGFGRGVQIPFFLRDAKGVETVQDLEVSNFEIRAEDGFVMKGYLHSPHIVFGIGKLPERYSNTLISERTAGVYALQNEWANLVVNQYGDVLWDGSSGGKYTLSNRALRVEEIVSIERYFPCARTLIEDRKGGKEYLKNFLISLKNLKASVLSQDQKALDQVVEHTCRIALDEKNSRLGRIYRVSTSLTGKRLDVRDRWVKEQFDLVLGEHENSMAKNALRIAQSFDRHDLHCQTLFDLTANAGSVFVTLQAGVSSLRCFNSDGRSGVYAGPILKVGGIGAGVSVSLETANPHSNTENLRIGRTSAWAFDSSTETSGCLVGVSGKDFIDHNVEHPIYGVGLFGRFGARISTPLPRIKKLPDNFLGHWLQLLNFIEAR